MQGATYFFTRSGSTWTQQQKLTASDGAAKDTFGDAVVMNSNVALISAGGSSTGGVYVLGSVYVFNWVASHTGGSWVQSQRILAPDQTDQTAFFGSSLALSGTQALAGARASTIGGNLGQGAAYVLAQSGSTWTVAAKLAASDGAARDNFGLGLGLNGSTAYIGSPGAAIIGAISQGALYRFTQSGSTWTQVQKVTASDGAAFSLFGASVSQSLNTVMVGSYAFDNYLGRAYLFTENTSGTLTQSDELSASDGVSGDVFGYFTALDPCTAIATSYTNDVNGHDEQGAAYFYSRVCLSGQ
jgi:hypothetical protein